MNKIKLAETEILVSRLGLGTVKFGRNQGVKYPTSFELPTDKEIKELLNEAQELGINLLDTAPAYGTSEERLGKVLTNRNEWVLCSKVGEEFLDGKSFFDFSPRFIRLSIERSLKRLKTDYLDIVLIHSNGEDKEIIEMGIFDTLAQIKQQGLIRAYGMSTKTVEGGLLAVEQADVVMVTYNPIQVEEKPVITYAHEKNKGILIKKALASGHIDKLAKEDPVHSAMEFIFREPGVTSIIVGTLNKDHLRSNVESAKIFS